MKTEHTTSDLKEAFTLAVENAGVPKTCRQLHKEHRASLKILHAEHAAKINSVAKDEFLIGTEVQWKMENHKHPIKGFVTGHVDSETAAVMCRSTGGIAAIVNAWDLDKV